MLFDRQKRLLALLGTLGGEVGGLDFQKLLFLYCSEETTPTYEFVPYKYGAFSFTSYADKRRLISRGLLENKERDWHLTEAGRAAAMVSSITQRKMENFVSRHRGLRGDDLVAETYRRHPYFATRSTLASRLLAGDAVALAAVEATRSKADHPALLTIGYEGLSLESYINRLLRAGVSLLCDVRRNPLSRKYGFSKSTLKHACEGVGIRYEHLPELGIASNERRNLCTQTDYDALFTEYRAALVHQRMSLDRIRRWISGDGTRLALTCFEADSRRCHRGCIADELERSAGPGFAPLHL